MFYYYSFGPVKKQHSVRFLCHQHTTAADCSENMVGSLSTKKLLKAALKFAAGGTGSAQDDRTEWLSVRNGGTRAAGPNTGVTLSNPSTITSRERGSRNKRERELVSFLLMVLCGGGDKVRALPL